jgi:DNA-binding protein H-NS
MALEQSTIEELAKLSIDLFNSPETKSAVLPLLKKVRPGLALPELDLQEQIGSATAEMSKKIQELQEKLARSETENQIREKRDALINKGLASREELPEIEKLMVEDGISDYEKAAKYHRATQTQSIPTPTPFRKPFEDAKTSAADFFKDSRSALKKQLWEGLQQRPA